MEGSERKSRKRRESMKKKIEDIRAKETKIHEIVGRSVQ